MGSFLPAAAFPARPGCRAVPFGRFPARRTHPSLCRAGKSTVFFRKKSPPLPYTCVKPARKKPKKPGFFFARPGTPPPGNPPAGTGKNPPGNPAGRPRPEPPGHTRRGRHPAARAHCPPGNPAARRREKPPARAHPAGVSDPPPPARAVPREGWSDPLVCLAATAPKTQRKVRHIPGGGLSNRQAAEKCKKSFGRYLAKPALKNPKGRGNF